MSYVLGCDVSKRKLDLCFVDEHGRSLWTEKIVNDEAVIAGFLLSIGGVYDHVTCVVESTGCYHLPFAQTAYAVGLPCYIYNPLLTKQQLKATIRGKKTDRTDALMIARIGLRGEGRPYSPERYLATRHYARGKVRIGELSGALERYTAHLTGLLGTELDPDAVAVLQRAHEAFRAVAKQFDHGMVATMPEQLSTRLQSIPGVGPATAATLIGEIQDMSRFRTSKQLIAYAGLDPRIRQSGHTLNRTGKLTKRGSAYLRRGLFLSANVARQHDPGFKALYDKKRSEGKTYTASTSIVARKLLTVIRAVWLSDTDYDSKHWGLT